MAWPFAQEDEFTADDRSLLNRLASALGTAPNDGTTVNMPPPSERLIDFGRRAFFPDQDFSGPQFPEVPDVVSETVGRLREAFVPGARGPAQGPTEVTQKPVEERSLDDQVAAYQESVVHAESALRGEVPPDKNHTLEILMAATEARGGDTPMSVEQKKEARSGLSKLIDRMNKSDRIDLLAAGLSIMQNSSKRNSPGQAIATGLLSGMQEATRNRIEKARQDIAARQVSAAERNARANEIQANATAQRVANAPTQAIIAAMSKNASPEQKAQADAILQQVAPNASEQELETLSGFFQQAVKEIQAMGGNMAQVGPLALQKAAQAGIPIEADTSLFGLLDGEGVRVGDESPLSSLADLLP